MRISIKRLLLAGLLLQFAAVSAHAQTPRPITLDEAKQIAFDRNPAMRRAETDQTNAELRQKQAKYGAFLPQFGSSLNFSIGRFRRYTAEDFAGEPLDNPYYAQAVSSSTSQSIGASMQLFSYSTWLELRSAKTGVRQSEQALGVERQRTSAEVERRFYRVLLADDAVRLEERFMNTARERLKAEEARLAAGVSLPADKLGAEIEVLDRETQLELVRGESLKSRLQLLDVLGFTEDVALLPTGTLPAAFDPSTIAADAIIARALTSSPRVQQAEMTLENSRLSQKRARAFRWPTIRGNVSYSRNRSGQGSGSFWDINPQNRGYDMGLQVSVPVPVLRFSEGISIRTADINNERLEADYENTRATVRREVQAGLLDLNNAWRRLKSAERAAQLSTERARLAGEQHKHGTMTFVELQTINDRDAQSQRALLDARLGFTNALLALEELLGGPLLEAQ
jgi:outer membrane protein TolC